MTTDRFAYLQTQRQELLQPDCPVYVHCSRRCIERRSGTVFLQVRMVNCTDREIQTVFLNVEGLSAVGETVYAMRELVLAMCAAKPHTAFGEDRLLVLKRRKVSALRITVERVAFADGMLWRRLPAHRITTSGEAGWKICDCGMPNPPDGESCRFCGKRLGAERKPASVPDKPQPMPKEPEPPAMPETFFLAPEGAATAQDAEPFPSWPIVPDGALPRPAPDALEMLLPEQAEERQDADEWEDEPDRPRWLFVLLCVLCAVAIGAIAGFVLFYLGYFPK